MPRVIDLHPQFQADANFARIEASGVKGVYVKATEGVTFAAPGFRDFAAKARREGIRTGFYHFLRPQEGRTGAQEANFFYSKVKGYQAGNGGLLRLVADIESTASDMTPWEVRVYTTDFIERLTELTSHRPLMYSFPSFLRWMDIQPDGFLSQQRLWIAHYTSADKPSYPDVFTGGWTMWQYTDSGTQVGVPGFCDLNRCPDLSEITLDRDEY